MNQRGVLVVQVVQTSFDRGLELFRDVGALEVVHSSAINALIVEQRKQAGRAKLNTCSSAPCQPGPPPPGGWKCPNGSNVASMCGTPRCGRQAAKPPNPPRHQVNAWRGVASRADISSTKSWVSPVLPEVVGYFCSPSCQPTYGQNLSYRPSCGQDLWQPFI